MRGVDDQFTLTQLQVRNEASPPSACAVSDRRGYDEQPNWLITADGVSMLDPSGQEDKASLFQIERGIPAVKRDGALQHIKHLVLSRMGMIRGFFPFSCDILHQRRP